PASFEPEFPSGCSNGQSVSALAREICWRPPSLRAEDLANAWAWVRIHGAEIEAQIADNESA
ncbi:MAG: hypothetical protein M3Z23_12645, partial [Acidobacteriota bacterium]|nr:hypothetical protein [Acidobacteriota bacterium]